MMRELTELLRDSLLTQYEIAAPIAGPGVDGSPEYGTICARTEARPGAGVSVSARSRQLCGHPALVRPGGYADWWASRRNARNRGGRYVGRCRNGFAIPRRNS
jgi:hypothetical protein